MRDTGVSHGWELCGRVFSETIAYKRLCVRLAEHTGDCTDQFWLASQLDNPPRLERYESKYGVDLPRSIVSAADVAAVREFIRRSSGVPDGDVNDAAAVFLNRRLA